MGEANGEYKRRRKLCPRPRRYSNKAKSLETLGRPGSNFVIGGSGSLDFQGGGGLFFGGNPWDRSAGVWDIDFSGTPHTVWRPQKYIPGLVSSQGSLADGVAGGLQSREGLPDGDRDGDGGGGGDRDGDRGGSRFFQSDLNKNGDGDGGGYRGPDDRCAHNPYDIRTQEHMNMRAGLSHL